MPTPYGEALPIRARQRENGARDLGARIDGDRAIRSVLRLLLLLYPLRLLAAIAVFAIKHSPLRLMPALTAAIIDIVASRGSLVHLAWLALAATAVLVQNYPANVWWVRLFNGVSRDLGAGLSTAGDSKTQHASAGAALIDPGKG